MRNDLTSQLLQMLSHLQTHRFWRATKLADTVSQLAIHLSAMQTRVPITPSWEGK